MGLLYLIVVKAQISTFISKRQMYVTGMTSSCRSIRIIVESEYLFIHKWIIRECYQIYPGISVLIWIRISEVIIVFMNKKIIREVLLHFGLSKWHSQLKIRFLIKKILDLLD